jgi:hypothetical protein
MSALGGYAHRGAFQDSHGPVTVRLAQPAWPFLYNWDNAARKFTAVKALRWDARHLPRVKSNNAL